MKVTLDTTDKPERKRNPPKSAFQPGNPYAFKPGESGRSRAKKPTQPDDVRLVSKALRAYLPYRAPDKITTRLGLPQGASWAQVCAMTLLYRGATGDVQALRAVHELSEGMRQRFALGFDADDGDGENAGGPRLTVSFVSARYEAGDTANEYKTIETDAEGVIRTFLGKRLVDERRPRTLAVLEEPAPKLEVTAQQPAPAPNAPASTAPAAKQAKNRHRHPDQPAPYQPPATWRA